MASELKQWPYQQTFNAIAAATRIEGGGIFISVEKFAEAFGPLPAPAATDTGLVTFSVEMLRDYAFMKADPEGDYVTRSQAVELLAAERAKYRDAMEKLVESQRETLVWQQRAIDLKADNAAKDARIKELEAALDSDPSGSDLWRYWSRKACEASQKYVDEVDRAEALKAKLAAAEQAARAAHETLIEINPSNYDHDDVCQLNDASVEAIFLLADILGETHGKTKEWWDERRAALGGKPS